jgi:Helix-turn-helix domain of resolvase
MKADGHTARTVAKYLGVSRATLYRYLVDEAAEPPAGAAMTVLLPPVGATTKVLPPGGGISALLSPPRGQQHSLVPTCQWVKGDSTYDIDSRST